MKRNLKYGVQVLVWVSGADKKSLVLLAKREGRSLSNYVRMLIHRESKKLT